MVHTILVNNDNSITKRMNGAIMQGSANVDSLRILSSPIYKDKFGDLVMTECTCVMEFITPNGRRYKTTPLTPSEELYKERLEYLIPITLDMTKEDGRLGFKFFFAKLEMNADGSFKERVRETDDSYLDIIPIALVFLIHLDGDILKAFDPASFLTVSNSTRLKLIWFII